MEYRDTIAAIATGAGAGGVGVIRVSGPDALTVLGRVFYPARPGGLVPRMLTYGTVRDSEGRSLDEVLAVSFPGPASFTGEDCAEIQGHGGPAVLAAVLEAVLDAGARQAEGGEFTRRAFMNGRLDLTQAEAVAELIAAPGVDGVRLASAKLEGHLGKRIQALRERLEYLRQRVCLAIDFPEEEGECLPPDEFLAIVREVGGDIRTLVAGYNRSRPWSEGAMVVLMGKVNAGKSSLMNALLGRPRAIVTDTPGTTRDYLEEHTAMAGMPVRLVDTAGLRMGSADPVEQEGMRLGQELAKQAQVMVIVVDGAEAAQGWTADQINGPSDSWLAGERELVVTQGANRCLLAWNKADVKPKPAGMETLLGVPVVEISAKTGSGIDILAQQVRTLCGANPPLPGEIAPNLRQVRLLKAAAEELAALEGEIKLGVPPDLCGLRLETSAAALADITGLNSAEDTLNAIFDEFCIGK